jgi:hypothetical protein
LNRRFEVHQGKGEDSPVRAVSNSGDSSNLKDIPPFNKRIIETYPTSGSTEGQIDAHLGGAKGPYLLSGGDTFMRPHPLKVKTEIKLNTAAYLDDETTEMESNNNNGVDEDDEVLIINGERSAKRFRRNESNKSLETDYLKSR